MTVQKPIEGLTVRTVPVAVVLVKDFDESQEIIICDLLDESGNILASNRYFRIADCGFTLTSRERAALRQVGANAPPDLLSTATVAEIKGWMIRAGIEFDSKDRKGDLITKANAWLNGGDEDGEDAEEKESRTN